MNSAATEITQLLDTLYRTESRRILATLIRLLGDFDLAEDALHDAFRVAMEQWGDDGPPANTRAWLVSTGRFKAIDRLRQRARFDKSLAILAEELSEESEMVAQEDACVESALSRARAVANGRDIRIGGGADVVRQYLNAGLVDEMHLALAPVFIGEGSRLFEGIDWEHVKVEQTESIPSPHVTHLRYAVSKR